MGKKERRFRKTITAAAAALLVLHSCLPMTGNPVQAEEETEQQDFLELTAQDLETEEGAAVSARLKIGDWLDYGDYGIERTDVPGTDYFFYITTEDTEGNLIDDGQLGYCLQSYFLTPMPGDHSAGMTDNVSEIGGGRSVQKVFYYGYGGAGYDADEFVDFLVRSDEEYYENIYRNLSESEQAELAYVLTHGAASYAYFTDGTPFEKYLELQFENKYGDDWEVQLGYFEEQELELSGIEDGDLNLLAATYGMNETGIALAKGWYQLLTEKKAPELDVTSEAGIYSFIGNERNEKLTLTFDVPDGLECTIDREDGTTESVAAGTTVTVRPSERFSFVFIGEAFASEEENDPVTDVSVAGTLNGAENEVWNLVLLETSKGTRETISKRQQDIAAVSRTNAGKDQMDFAVELQGASVSVKVRDEDGQAVPQAVFEVFYDEECSMPAKQEGENVTVTTDEAGEASLKFVINQKLLENGEKLFLRETAVPAGYIMDDTVYCMDAGGSVEITNARETTSVSGTVSWRVPEGTKLPEEISVELKKDGEISDIQTVTEGDGWSYAWDGLPKYHVGVDGMAEEYEYSIDAEPVEGYSTTVDGNDIVNTIIGETSKEGQVIWHDNQDADGLRPESITVDLHRDETLADSMQVAGEDDWKYCFDGLDQYSEDGTKENVYTVIPQIPDGYTAESEGSEIIFTHPASVSPEIEITVDLKGRELKDGEFSFDLTQVTDETGKTETEDGIRRTAVNDLDGKVAFEDIQVTEPGTYYYRITKTPDTDDTSVSEEAVIAKAEVTVGGDDQDQLEAVVTYPQGQPEFAYTYTAGGAVAIDGIQTVLENGTLAKGMFRFELKDSSGNVLQTVENDENGNAAFDPLKFTEENMGQKLEYTVSEVNGGTDGITYDSTVYTVLISVEDSKDSDGTLQISKESDDMVFTNIMAVSETEMAAEETGTETTEETGTETETTVETETESETAEETEAKVTEETETRTEIVTEAEPETKTHDETEVKAASETENQDGGHWTVVVTVISLIVILLLILFIVWKKMKNNKM